MARSILLIDPDVDALGALASRLRSRGLEVTLADQLEGAAERTRRARPDAILICESLLSDRGAAASLSSEKEFQDVPCFALSAVTAEQLDTLAPDQLPRSDVDLIVKRLFALPKTPPPVEAQKGDFRGDIEQVSVVDLLQLLGMNRRTGALTLTTPSGVGEVRLVEGDIVDAVYRRLEGEKALYRVLAEQSGSFAFVSSLGTSLRRVETPTHHLLIDGMRRIDEVAARRESLKAGSDALLSVVPPAADAPEVEHRVTEVLSVPRTIDELLDELPIGDLEILDAVTSMLGRADLRRIPRASARVELADAEQMSVLSAMVSRLAPPGYRGHPRIVIAATSERIGALAHAVRRVSDATPPADSPPATPSKEARSRRPRASTRRSCPRRRLPAVPRKGSCVSTRR